LWIGEWTCGFHKIRGITWAAKKLLASQEGLCSMELVSLFICLFVCLCFCLCLGMNINHKLPPYQNSVPFPSTFLMTLNHLRFRHANNTRSLTKLQFLVMQYSFQLHAQPTVTPYIWRS
jgi:hypothetical protein